MEEQLFDIEKYASLLTQTLPRVIETADDHERMLGCAEELMDKGENLSREERKILELLVLLIEVFEQQADAVEDEEGGGEHELPEPHETLQRLLEARGWEPIALNDIFGNPKLVADVLSGQRGISRGQARELGKLFQVPPKLFLTA